MNTHTDKNHENKDHSIAIEVNRMKNVNKSSFQLVDNRPETIVQRKLQQIANNNPQVEQLKAFQEVANSSAQAENSNETVPRVLGQINGKCKNTIKNGIIQRQKKLKEKPELPPQPEWKNAAWAHYEAEIPDQEEEIASEQPLIKSPAHSDPKEKGFMSVAIPGKQMGTNGTLFMVKITIPNHHISIECRPLENGRLEITGGHFTNEEIPEGEKGRHKNLTESQLALYRKQAEKMQLQLDKKEAEQRELQHKQEEAAELAKNKNNQVKALRTILDQKIKIKKDRDKITDAVLISAVENGWTPELFEGVASKEKDIVQLARLR